MASTWEFQERWWLVNHGLKLKSRNSSTSTKAVSFRVKLDLSGCFFRVIPFNLHFLRLKDPVPLVPSADYLDLLEILVDHLDRLPLWTPCCVQYFLEWPPQADHWSKNKRQGAQNKLLPHSRCNIQPARTFAINYNSACHSINSHQTRLAATLIFQNRGISLGYSPFLAWGSRHIQSRDAFRPIVGERKYMMDYKSDVFKSLHATETGDMCRLHQTTGLTQPFALS